MTNVFFKLQAINIELLRLGSIKLFTLCSSCVPSTVFFLKSQSFADALKPIWLIWPDPTYVPLGDTATVDTLFV